jgi:VWFA-related protein
MRLVLAAALIGLVLVAAGPAVAENAGEVLYHVAIDRVFPVIRERDGRRALYVSVQFRVTHATDGSVATHIPKDDIIVKEDGGKVADLEIFAPHGADQLTTVLAMDTSGSMTDFGKIGEAKRAANAFLDHLGDKADSGLILFNHELYLSERLETDPSRFAAHRTILRQKINAAQPAGGTAYLDATAAAVNMLASFHGRRAVVLMTDGVDLNSERSLDNVIEHATGAEVPVYTLGVGEPGKNEPVTTVLVLDRSGSMIKPADDNDRTPKFMALQEAASRFVDIMRPAGRTTLLPFSSMIAKPKPLTADKAALKKQIADPEFLKPRGGTLLYDATLEGIETLAAARPAGKRAVVVLTDGVDEDPGSRHRVEEVIQRAQETNTPLHMLGLGRTGEINEEVMKRMAAAVPGGSFNHVRNQKELYAIFEQLSIDLHDDGIDEASLRKLAEQTGGKYFLARDVSQLKLIYEQLAEELQSTYTVTFPSRRSSHDGTARGIDISIWHGNQQVSEVASAGYNVHGVVVPEMDPRVYLILLGLLSCLLVAPSGVRRLYRFYGGA